jgi:hypothetical protein
VLQIGVTILRQEFMRLPGGVQLESIRRCGIEPWLIQALRKGSTEGAAIRKDSE